jgi:hypothetical protein
MRRILLASTLFVAGCATAPQAPTPEPLPAAPQARPETGAMIGMNAAQLVSRFGNPALQVREGTSLKLQFRNSRCVLDAYLYPHASSQAGNELRVTHVDTRAPSGIQTNQSVCAATFETAN